MSFATVLWRSVQPIDRCLSQPWLKKVRANLRFLADIPAPRYSPKGPASWARWAPTSWSSHSPVPRPSCSIRLYFTEWGNVLLFQSIVGICLVSLLWLWGVCAGAWSSPRRRRIDWLERRRVAGAARPAITLWPTAPHRRHFACLLQSRFNLAHFDYPPIEQQIKLMLPFRKCNADEKVRFNERWKCFHSRNTAIGNQSRGFNVEISRLKVWAHESTFSRYREMKRSWYHTHYLLNCFDY